VVPSSGHGFVKLSGEADSGGCSGRGKTKLQAATTRNSGSEL
jgi:hypothetical protein